jgi:zinc transporter ZupT
LGYLLLSIAALTVGPILHAAVRSMRPALDAIDRIVFVAVVGLVMWKLVPHAYEEAGWIALPVVAGAWLTLWLVERALRERAERADEAAALIAFAGFAIHETLDGVALATSGSGGAILLSALVLHRLPVGLTVWLMLRPLHGTRGAIVGIVILALGTVAGFVAGSELNRALEGMWAGLLQAAVCGALLHLALHRHDHHDGGHAHPHEHPHAHDAHSHEGHSHD